MKTFNMIVAMDVNRGIGIKGCLPWALSGDLKRFKEITSTTLDRSKKNAVIMGRKTWESIPEKFRPLPGRINLVLTRNQKLHFPEGVLSSESIDAALKKFESSPWNEKIEEIFVIGGQQIFEEMIRNSYCRKLYVTHILKSFTCDTFFSPIPEDFNPTVVSGVLKENDIKYRFVVYARPSLDV